MNWYFIIFIAYILFGVFFIGGYLGPKMIKQRLQKFWRWYEVDANPFPIAMDPYRPLSNAFEIRKTGFIQRFKNRYFDPLDPLVVTILLVYSLGFMLLIFILLTHG